MWTAGQIVDDPGLPKAHFGFGAVIKLAVVVASDSGQVARDQKISGASGVERAGKAIAKVDDLGNATPIDISKHGFKRGAVAVDVGDDGGLHVGDIADFHPNVKGPGERFFI